MILDACRADFFKEAIDLKGTYSSRISRGTSTYHFVRSNFGDRDLCDTVYVSASGWPVRLQDELGYQLHSIRYLEEDEYHDDEVGATLPSAVTSVAKEYADRYPNKRLIAHYVQPHKPYLGDFGRGMFGKSQKNLQKIMSSDEVTEADLKRAYRENLGLVLEHVKDLVSDLEGKTVITADHAELLGERASPIPVKVYGHPSYLYHDALVEVPWFECDYNHRREITSDPPVDVSDTDEELLTEHLRDLGYAT